MICNFFLPVVEGDIFISTSPERVLSCFFLEKIGLCFVAAGFDALIFAGVEGCTEDYDDYKPNYCGAKKEDGESFGKDKHGGVCAG